MAGTLQRSKVIAVISWDFRDTGVPLVQSISRVDYSKLLAGATGALNANRVIVKQYTIAASGTQDLDLSGVQTDPEGVVVSLTKLRGIIVVHETTTTSTGIEFGPRNAASNPLAGLFNATTNALIIANGGCVLVCNPTLAGYTVTNASADTLRITNQDGTNSATVTVAFLGEG